MARRLDATGAGSRWPGPHRAAPRPASEAQAEWAAHSPHGIRLPHTRLGLCVLRTGHTPRHARRLCLPGAFPHWCTTCWMGLAPCPSTKPALLLTKAWNCASWGGSPRTPSKAGSEHPQSSLDILAGKILNPPTVHLPCLSVSPMLVGTMSVGSAGYPSLSAGRST